MFMNGVLVNGEDGKNVVVTPKENQMPKTQHHMKITKIV
jgi:hypothetical protein